MIRINTSDLEVGYGKKTIIKNINIDIQKTHKNYEIIKRKM